MEYFDKKNLTESASIFIQESQKAKNNWKGFEQILETLERGNHQKFVQIWNPKFEEVFSNLSKGRKDQGKRRGNLMEELEDLLCLDLKLHFAFLSREVNPNGENKSSVSKEVKSFFANYLSEKVDVLTSIPQLSKYFAIPYISQPQNNPIFQESFSVSWSGDLRTGLKKLFQGKGQVRTTKLETCLANFSKFRMSYDASWGKSECSGEVRFLGKENKRKVVKSTENRKMLDMLSRRESLSVGRGDLSEWQSSAPSELMEIRRKMLEFKLVLKQKEHRMRMKDWENKECLEKSHQKWIYFVK